MSDFYTVAALSRLLEQTYLLTTRLQDDEYTKVDVVADLLDLARQIKYELDTIKI